MKIDAKKLAKEHLAKTRDANKDAEGKSQQDYGPSDAKDSYHTECMRKFIEAVHSKEPHEAHKAMVEYAMGEPHRQDQEGRSESEDKDSKMSVEDMAKHYRKAQY